MGEMSELFHRAAAAVRDGEYRAGLFALVPPSGSLRHDQPTPHPLATFRARGSHSPPTGGCSTRERTA